MLRRKRQDASTVEAIKCVQDLKNAHLMAAKNIKEIGNGVMINLTHDGLWKMGYDERNCYMVTGYHQLTRNLVDFKIAFFKGYTPVKVVSKMRSRLFVIKGGIINDGIEWGPGDKPLEISPNQEIMLEPTEFPTLTLSVISLDGSDFDGIPLDEKVLRTALVK